MVMAGAGGDVDVDLDVVDGGAGGLDIWATSCREEDEAPALTLVRPIVLSLSIDEHASFGIGIIIGPSVL